MSTESKAKAFEKVQLERERRDLLNASSSPASRRRLAEVERELADRD